MARIPNESDVICYAVQFQNSGVKLNFFDIKQESKLYVCDQNFEMKRENGIW